MKFERRRRTLETRKVVKRIENCKIDDKFGQENTGYYKPGKNFKHAVLSIIELTRINS